MLTASLIIAAIATWLAFHLLADALDHISNETAKAHGFTSTDGEGEPLSRMAGGGEAGDGAERLGSHTHSLSNRTGTEPL